MRPNKLRSVTPDLRHEKHCARRTKMMFAGQKELQRFAHQIANQLTVINLSCFKLRHAAANVLPASSLEDLERVERAVDEITSFIQILQPEEDPPPHTANICSLFDSPQK